MSGIAQVLQEMGFVVSGSDIRESPLTKRLEGCGVRVCIGHAPNNIEGADVVVVSSAVPTTNPEVIEAARKNIPVLQRAEMLGYLMQSRCGIAVAGTHGKTTTTSMIALILEKNGLDPTVVIGGELNDIGSNAKLGKGNHLVAEADESDASFLKLYPSIAIVTNIDVDVNLNTEAFAQANFDYDKTMNLVKIAFKGFLNNIKQSGLAVVCTDNKQVMELLPAIKCKVLTYGFDGAPDLTAKNLYFKGSSSKALIYYHGNYLGEILLQIPGRHNISNALAAIGVALEIGLSFESISSALSQFHGVKRRFQMVRLEEDVMVVDDYAHNPAKIMATLSAAREGWKRRIVAVFQPHRYTRTKFLKNEFARSFRDADKVIVTEIYSAGECPIVGVKGKRLAELIKNENPDKEVVFLPTKDDVLSCLKATTRSGDFVITLGAGDIYQVAKSFTEELAGRNGKCHLLPQVLINLPAGEIKESVI